MILALLGLAAVLPGGCGAAPQPTLTELPVDAMEGSGSAADARRAAVEGEEERPDLREEARLACAPSEGWSATAPAALRGAAQALEQAVGASDSEGVERAARQVVEDAWALVARERAAFAGLDTEAEATARRALLRELMAGDPALLAEGLLGLRPSDELLRALAWAALLEGDAEKAEHWMAQAGPNALLFERDLICRALLIVKSGAPAGDLLDWLPPEAPWAGYIEESLRSRSLP